MCAYTANVSVTRQNIYSYTARAFKNKNPAAAAKPYLVEQLQHYGQDVGVRLVDLVKQHDGLGISA